MSGHGILMAGHLEPIAGVMNSASAPFLLFSLGRVGSAPAADADRSRRTIGSASVLDAAT